MPKKRVILELGSGNDLHGSDYTKAALRAVQDALHHSSLSFLRSLKVDKTKLDAAQNTSSATALVGPSRHRYDRSGTGLRLRLVVG